MRKEDLLCNIGDVVEICHEPQKGCDVGWGRAMDKYCGKTAVVTRIEYFDWGEIYGYRLDIDGGRWKWSDQLISRITVPDLPEFEAPQEGALLALFQ